MLFKRFDTDKVARSLLALSVLMATFAYGVVAEHYGLFPVTWMKTANAAVEAMLEDSGTKLPWYFIRTTARDRVHIREQKAMAPGLTLVVGIAQDDVSIARVVDATGRTLHSWRMDWFAIRPRVAHVPSDELPKSNGGLVHGVTLMQDGDIVFNFSGLGMFRLDPCGKIVWQLPYRTHHSIFVDEQGNLWAPGKVKRDQPIKEVANYRPPFDDFMILKISPEGRVLEEHSVLQLLIKNHLEGLLYMSSIANRSTIVTGDTLHLNDVEIFPTTLASGVFNPGDVMVSLRNINAILVFDPRDWHVKFMNIGAFIRQHDPNFVDGNTISVVDNNNLAIWRNESYPDHSGHYSRIARVSAKTGEVTTVYKGTADHPFFTDIMGQHQLLPNGNILITEAIAGRVFEIDPNGNIVWEYFNVVGDGILGIVDDSRRLPLAFDQAFFNRLSATCQQAEN